MPEKKWQPLTFETFSYGYHESRWDLRIFMYSGGAALRKNMVASAIETETLGPPILKRQPLILELHRILNATVVRGGSKKSLENEITAIRELYRYADVSGVDITEQNAKNVYVLWLDHEARRVARHEIKGINRDSCG